MFCKVAFMEFCEVSYDITLQKIHIVLKKLPPKGLQGLRTRGS